MLRSTELVSLNSDDELRYYDLFWEASFPPETPLDEIGINAKRLSMAMRIAGMRTLSVDGQEESDGPALTAEEATVWEAVKDPFGTAKTAVGLKTYEVDTPLSDERSFPEYAWSDPRITLDIRAMKERILARKKSLEDPKPWAKEINSALKKGIDEGGYSQLILGGGRVQMLAMLGFGSLLDFADISDLSLARTGACFLATSAIVQSFSYFVAQEFEGKRGEKRRLSVVPGMQIDRMAALSGYLAMSRFVKPINFQS